MRHLALPLLLVTAVPSIAVAQQTMREQVLTMGVSEEIVVADYPSLSLSALTSAAGAVVRVAVRSNDTFLSSDGMAILTDSRATVLDVLKDSAAGSISAGDVITIRRSGGVLNIEGRTVVSTENGFPSFARGHEYVLFLKTDAGQPFAMLAGPQSAFQIDEGAIAPITGSTKGSSALLVPLFVHEVKAFLAQGSHTASQR